MRLALSTTVLLLAAASAPAAEMISFRVGVNGYSASRDTYLQQANPDAALGAETAISIDASDGGGISQALLSFDSIIGPAAIPAGSSILSATLELTVDSAGSGLTMYRMLTDWSESSSTWNSLTNGIQADGTDARSTPSLSIGANTPDANISSAFVLLNVTDDIQAWSNGESNFGWAMLPFVPNGTNGLDFFSKEDLALSSRPLLTVSYVIPEPASLGLLLPTAVIALRRRR